MDIPLRQVRTQDIPDDLNNAKGGNKGKFTIKHALKIIPNEIELDEGGSVIWELAWTAPVQQRVRVFLWLLFHNRVLCNANRLKRRLTDDPRCPQCQGDEETLIHMLRDCPVAREIWRQVGGSSRYNHFFQGDLNTWLVNNLKAEGLSYSNQWPTYFAITIWWTWRWRNCVAFGKSEEVPLNIRDFLYSRAEEQIRAMKLGSRHLNGPRVSRNKEIFIRWIAPPLDWIVLNSDGAARGAPGHAGAGGLIRDSRGGFMVAYAANLGICSAYKAEMWVVARGLDLARERAINKLLVQMDNLACIQILENDTFQGGECHHIINYFRHLLRLEDREVLIMHVYREGNRGADWLANYGADHDDHLLIFYQALDGLTPILNDDISGVAVPRVVSS
ncbi:hypothetical protein RDABS01_023971 [Bienertia sinuspersici]